VYEKEEDESFIKALEEEKERNLFGQRCSEK
jgi:hypothetical protein